MVDEGLIILVQGNAGVLAIAPTGGYLAEQPKDDALPSWGQKTISNPSYSTLASFTGLTMRRWQVDCYANDGADAIGLARAIDAVLNGFRGVLADPDATYVDHCFRSDLIDFFDEAGRTYRRMLEYEVWFVQN